MRLNEPCPHCEVVLVAGKTAYVSGRMVRCKRKYAERAAARAGLRRGGRVAARRTRSPAQKRAEAFSTTEYRRESRARIWSPERGWVDVRVVDDPETGRRVIAERLKPATHR